MDEDPLAGLKTPDVTPTDLASGAGSLLSIVVVLAGLDMTDAQKGAIVGAIVAIWGAVTVIADMLRRRGRAKIVVAHLEAKAQVASDAAFAAANVAAKVPIAPGSDLPAEDQDPPDAPEVPPVPDGDDRDTRSSGGDTVPKPRGAQT